MLRGYISRSDGWSLRAICPASATRPTLSPMAARDFMWMKSGRTKPCFCGYLSCALLTPPSLWLSKERHLVAIHSDRRSARLLVFCARIPTTHTCVPELFQQVSCKGSCMNNSPNSLSLSLSVQFNSI